MATPEKILFGELEKLHSEAAELDGEIIQFEAEMDRLDQRLVAAQAARDRKNAAIARYEQAIRTVSSGGDPDSVGNVE